MDYEALAAASTRWSRSPAYVGVHVEEVGPGTARVTLPDGPERSNHVGSQHAGALFTAGEAASGGAFVGSSPSAWPRSRRSPRRPRSPTEDRARADHRARDARQGDGEELLAELDREGRVRFPVAVELTDAEEQRRRGDDRPLVRAQARMSDRAAPRVWLAEPHEARDRRRAAGRVPRLARLRVAVGELVPRRRREADRRPPDRVPARRAARRRRRRRASRSCASGTASGAPAATACSRTSTSSRTRAAAGWRARSRVRAGARARARLPPRRARHQRAQRRGARALRGRSASAPRRTATAGATSTCACTSTTARPEPRTSAGNAMTADPRLSRPAAARPSPRRCARRRARVDPRRAPVLGARVDGVPRGAQRATTASKSSATTATWPRRGTRAPPRRRGGPACRRARPTASDRPCAAGGATRAKPSSSQKRASARGVLARGPRA